MRAAVFSKACFTVFALSSGPALSAEDCSKSLVRTEVISSSSEVSLLSLAWSLSEDAYQEERTEAGTKGSAWSGLFEGSANYGEFRSKLSRRAQELGIHNFTDRALSYATSALGPAGLDAYKSCLTSNETGQIDVIVEQIGQDTYTVSVMFAPPAISMAGSRGRLVRSGNISDAESEHLNGELSAITFGDGGVERHLLIMPQDRSKEVALEIGAGERASKSIILPPLEPVKALPPSSSERQLREELRNGAPALLTFSKDACGLFDMGNIQCGYEYSVQYNRLNNGWRMVGNTKDGVWGDATYYNARKTAGSPRGHLSAWGINDLAYSSKGEVRRKGRTIGRIWLAP